MGVHADRARGLVRPHGRSHSGRFTQPSATCRSRDGRRIHLGDSYCSLAWGKRLAAETGPEVAGAVIRGGPRVSRTREGTGAVGLDQWRRDPNATESEDVATLRDAGFDEAQIFAITAFVALRLAFSTINDALGVRPDSQLGASTPAPVLSAVTFGRPLGPDHE